MPQFQKIIEYLSSLAPEKKGRHFEHYCKWFLENDPRYKHILKTVWLWDAWPGKWARDKGIDLIAETFHGEIWAIQAKAYDEAYYITKEDVDSFLSESNRQSISVRLLIGTTNNIGANAREVMAAQEKKIATCLLSDLEAAELIWPTSIEELIPYVPTAIKTPRPHQQEAIDNVIKGFETSSFGQLHMACGTGKTLVGLWLHERLRSKSTLVLVPSISLVNQLYREWSANAQELFDPIFVCSDPTVRHKDDGYEYILEGLADLPFAVTTEAADIVKYFLAENVGRPKVIFSTYHSSPVLEQACKMNARVAFDLVIGDEAHRCAGKANSDFALVVDSQALRVQKKLFMTATPKIFSNHVKSVTKEMDCAIVSMDDPATFGPVFHAFSFSQAIERDLLSDYQVLISVMDNKTYREYAERGRIVTHGNHETNARTLAAQIMVAKAISEYELKKVITFHSRQKQAQEFVDTLPRALAMLLEVQKPIIGFNDAIFGDMRQNERLQKIKQFGSVVYPNSGVLANVRCLSEGVDVPALDGVVFVDPKGSEIDIVQAVGRAIRKSQDKKIGTIIIPVFVEQEELAIANLEDSAFKKVWQVLKALRAHDNVLAEELDTIRLELGKQAYRAPAKLKKIVIDVPIGVDVSFGESLRLKIVERCTESWNYFFGVLQQFREQYPDRWPSKVECFPDRIGCHIGWWCQQQRKKMARGILQSVQIENLENIGFVWDVLEAAWEEQYQHLGQFRKIYPDRWPSHDEKFPMSNKIDLYSWCSTQRLKYNNGKISVVRIKKLEDVGFFWSVAEAFWNDRYEDLLKFRKINCDRWPAQREQFGEEKRINLGTWCGSQRLRYKNENLLDYQFKKLEDIGFPWNLLEDSWDNTYRCLIAFRKIYPDRWPGNQDISVGDSKLNLNMWCGTQRKRYKNKRMSQNRIEKLEKIGFIFDVFNCDWEEQYGYLLDFKKVFPDRWPSRNECFSEGNRLILGEWCKTQQSRKKNNIMSEDQIKKLEKINFPWNKYVCAE